jgi:hypothetical protein
MSSHGKNQLNEWIADNFAANAGPQQASSVPRSRLKSQVAPHFNVNLLAVLMNPKCTDSWRLEDFCMFGRFFDTKSVDEFADWIVEEVKRTLPPAFDPHLKNVSGKVDRLDRRIAERTTSFTQSSKINLYQKARLASRVREGMSAFGYPQPFVKSFSMDIIARVMRASRAR